MDDARFDHLAKSFAETGSRRRLLRRALAAAPLAVGLTALRGEAPAAEAKRRVRSQGNAKGNSCKATGQICGELFGAKCCHPLTCTTGPLGVSSCQRACTNDNMCREAYPGFQTRCLADVIACPFIEGGKCCVPKICITDGDCASPFTCQGGQCKRVH